MQNIVLFIIIFLFAACNFGSETPTPKPRGYPKIIWPERGFKAFDEKYCNFTFEYPVYSTIIRDTKYFGEQPIHPCWFDIDMPVFNSKIHCSYYPISKEISFEELRDQAFKLTYKHTVRANSIDEVPIENAHGAKGMTFLLEGPAATAYTFYFSDEKEHFLRGSLYFNTQARPDSLAPVIDFIREDINRITETFQWQ